MEHPLPQWSMTAWWTEHKKDTPAYKHRLYDFLNICKHGLPVVIMKDGEVVDVMLAVPAECEKEVNFGTPESPNPQIICQYCGQRKDEFMDFSLACSKGESHKGTKTAGWVRTVSPFFPDCFADCGWSSNWVWVKCVHIRAWKENQFVSRKSKGRFIESSVPPEVKELTAGIGRIEK